MGALDLLQALWAQGATVARSGSNLRVGMPGGLTDRQRALISEHKPDLLLLCDGLAFRVEAMFARLEPGKAFPFLVARPGPALPGHCLSCGEPSAERRCPLCARAAHLVTAEAMRVRPTPPPPVPMPPGWLKPEE